MSKTFRTAATFGAITACTLLSGAAHAQSPLQYITTGSTSTVGFNTTTAFANGTNSFSGGTTIPGVYSNRPTIFGDNGGLGTGALYAFRTSNSSTENALGSVGSGSVTSINYGIAFTNNTSDTLTRFDISFTQEQWRRGSATNTNEGSVFDYILTDNLDASTISATSGYTPVTSLNLTVIQPGGTAGALDGNLAVNQAVKTGTSAANFSWAPGQILFLRFTDSDSSGTDAGLAVDNFNFVAVPEPGTFALALLGAVPMGAMVLRRRRAAARN